jgi:transporter family-2 protein
MTGSFNTYFFMFLALLTGVAMSTQAVVNSKLAVYVGSPVLAGFISFVVGTAALFIYILVSGTPLGNLAGAKYAPAIAWIGGFLGAFFVLVMATIVPRIGLALSFSLAIAGQMLIALVMDHFGFLGIPERGISWPRVLGVLLIAVGIVLIRRF